MHHFKAISEFTLELQPGNAQFGSKLVIFCPLWSQNLMHDLENKRSHLLCYLKLRAPFHRHLSIQNGVTVRKRQIWVKIAIFFVPCDLEIWQMTLKNNRPSLLCYFTLYGSFRSHLWNQNEVIVWKHQNRWSLVPFDLDIWQMTLKNNKAPLQCYFKLCASIHRHPWIQSGVTVRKRLSRFWPLWPLPLTSDLHLIHGYQLCHW